MLSHQKDDKWLKHALQERPRASLKGANEMLAGLHSSEDLIGAGGPISLVVVGRRLHRFLRQIFYEVSLNSLFKSRWIYD